MIQYFRVENYRSIGKEQTISFEANSDTTHSDVLLGSSSKILPVIPIYGGNATGKTNILKGIKTFVEIANGKIDIEQGYEPCKFYEDNKETIFQIIFLVDEIKYYYKLSFNGISVVEEALYYYPNNKLSKIYHKKDNEYTFGVKFQNTLGKFSENISENICFMSFLSKFFKDSEKPLHDSILFFKEKFIFINLDKESLSLSDTKKLLKKYEGKEKNTIMNFINYFYKHMNVGAKRIVFESKINLEDLSSILKDSHRLNKSKKLKLDDKAIFKILLENATTEDSISLLYETKKGEISIPIEEESEGIRKIFTLGFPLAEALSQGKIILIDEIEIGFHPLLSRKIIELFLKSNCSAQLILSTHNTNLLNLELFRRDQIYFTSRTSSTNFQTYLKPLGEIGGIRKNSDIEKAYLLGKYSDAPAYTDFNIEEVGDIFC